MRILVVEDEIHLAEALVQLLKKQNYTVDSVYDGEDGLDYAMSNIYDVNCFRFNAAQNGWTEYNKEYEEDRK